jgi:hypothetical protein
MNRTRPGGRTRATLAVKVEDLMARKKWIKVDIEGMIEVVALVEIDPAKDVCRVLSYKAMLQDDHSSILHWVRDSMVEGQFEEIKPQSCTMREVSWEQWRDL